MKVSFNFDTGARRIRLLPEDELEISICKEMAYLGTKGVNMKIADVTGSNVPPNSVSCARIEYEIEMRINGFAEGKEKKSE